MKRAPPMRSTMRERHPPSCRAILADAARALSCLLLPRHRSNYFFMTFASVSAPSTPILLLYAKRKMAKYYYC